MQECGSLEKPRAPIPGTDSDRNKCEASEWTAVEWEVGANSWGLGGETSANLDLLPANCGQQPQAA